MNNSLVLVSCTARETPELERWLTYHLSLGFDRIILYQRPGQAAPPTGAGALEAAGRLERRALNLDVGSPLKSAIFSAMTQDGLPDCVWAMALEVGAYLTLDDGLSGLAGALPGLAPDCAAWCLPMSAQGGEVRTLFRPDSFQGHDGARPMTPKAGDAPIWCDGSGAVIDPDETFWSDAPVIAADAPARIITPGDRTDPRCAVLRTRIDAPEGAESGARVQIAAVQPPPATSPVASPVETPIVAGKTPEPHEPTDTDTRPDWYHEISPGGSATGFYRRLEHQSLIHIHRPSDTLVVTFDNLSAVNDLSPARAPWGYKFLREAGCAQLGILAHRKDWYREPGLIAELESLRDQGLFRDYRDVIFTGTSMGGFAALAFSSLSPGARVLAFSPQSTLDEAIVPWETRFGMGRMRNWRLPFSDAAFEIEEAAEVIVISDPYFALDQRHVDRLGTPNVMQLKAWFSGHFSPVFLRRADLLKPVMAKMIEGTLTQEAFYRLYRGRRLLPWYRRSLQEALETRGRTALAARVGPAFLRARSGTGV